MARGLTSLSFGLHVMSTILMQLILHCQLAHNSVSHEVSRISIELINLFALWLQTIK